MSNLNTSAFTAILEQGSSFANGVFTGTAASDIITIGEGPNTLDAGAGDDVVTAGLGNTPSAAFSGGAGSDTLNLTVAAYEDFNYKSASFEQATLYSDSGEVLGRYREVGTKEIYTEYNFDSAESWSRRVSIIETDPNSTSVSKGFEYAVSGDLYQIFSVFNNGDLNIVTYDLEGESPLWDVSSQTIDFSETSSFSSHTNYYAEISGSLVRTRLVIERDDSYTSDETFILFGRNAGTSIRTLTDTAEDQTWESWAFTLSNSDEVMKSARTNDDGIINTVTYDLDDIFDWGSTVQNEDSADAFNWASTERVVDEDGSTSWFGIEYDDGTSVEYDYLPEADEAWTRKVSLISESGNITERYYDAENVLYDTVYIDVQPLG